MFKLSNPDNQELITLLECIRVHWAWVCIYKYTTKKSNAYLRMSIHSKSVWLTTNECVLEYAFTNAPPKIGTHKKATL
jgi:hypothetical protein